MKNKKVNFILVFILIILLIGNIYYMFNNIEYSNDNEDDKILKFNDNYKKETDEYIYGIIYDGIKKIINYTNEKTIDGVLSLLDDEYVREENINEENVLSLFDKITDFSLQEVYKSQNETGGIYYTRSIVEKNNKLSNIFLIINLNYDDETYEIKVTDNDNFEKAKKNRQEKIKKISISNNSYNKYSYNYDTGEILYRYINDYYLKYKYLKKEAYELMINKKGYDNYIKVTPNVEKIEVTDIISFNEKINDDNITYDVKTINRTYEIVISSAMDYKINVE